MSLSCTFPRYLVSNNGMSFQSGLVVIQGHLKWQNSIITYEFLSVCYCKYSCSSYHFCISTLKNVVTLKSRVGSTQGHWMEMASFDRSDMSSYPSSSPIIHQNICWKFWFFHTPSRLCLKKLDPHNSYDIISSIHNIYALFLVGIDVIQFSVDYVKFFKLAENQLCRFHNNSSDSTVCV